MPYEIEQKQRKQPPAGNHIARLVWFIDLGTQETEWKGEVKHLHKVRFSWELPTEKEVFDPEKGEQPFMVHKTYTLSFGDKANLRKDLESWRGRKFTDDELKTFDETKIVGKPCMVNIVHNEKAGKVYANVTGITNLPKGMEAPEQINPSVIYNAHNGEDSVYMSFPDWLQEQIAKSPQFKRMASKQHPEDHSQDDGPLDPSAPDCPF